jgi:hypothetical protein
MISFHGKCPRMMITAKMLPKNQKTHNVLNLLQRVAHLFHTRCVSDAWDVRKNCYKRKSTPFSWINKEFATRKTLQILRDLQ